MEFLSEFFGDLRLRIETMLNDRRISDAWLGLGALLSLSLLGIMILATTYGGDSDLSAGLETQARTDLSQGRYAEARIAAMRLAQTGEKVESAAVLEARALQGLGRVNESQRLLVRISPDDHPGFSPGHVVRALGMLSQPEPATQAAAHQVDLALLAEPTNQDALELAARFDTGRGDWKAVVQHLEGVNLEKRPDLMLVKARALQFSGVQDGAIQWAAKAEAALRAMRDLDKESEERVRISIAAAMTLQRKFEPAVAWMLKSTGGNLSTEDRHVVGGVYHAWSCYLKTIAGGDQSRVFELLEKGLEYSPESEELLTAFLNECDEAAPDDQKRQQLMERVLGGGGVPTSFLHYYLGVREWKRGSAEMARTHFEVACKLNPGFTAVTNNLALAIASLSTDPADLNRALSMMDQLLKREPRNPYFLDTRGQVLAKLGRLQDALRDLETALPGLRDKADTHAKLAEVYQKMGMRDLAEQHHHAATVAVAPVR